MSDVLKTLVERGWRGPEKDYASYGEYVWADRSMFPHRPICDCNEKPASLCLHRYRHQEYEGFELSLRFEKKGAWYDLKAYSIRTLEEIDAAIDPLIAAGIAVSKA